MKIDITKLVFVKIDQTNVHLKSKRIFRILLMLVTVTDISSRGISDDVTANIVRFSEPRESHPNHLIRMSILNKMLLPNAVLLKIRRNGDRAETDGYFL